MKRKSQFCFIYPEQLLREILFNIRPYQKLNFSFVLYSYRCILHQITNCFFLFHLLVGKLY